MSELKDAARNRAGGICEYCRFPDSFATFRYQLDRIVAGQHGGKYSFDNCAWCCAECNQHKLSNLASIDPETEQRVWLFDPRSQDWNDHFEWRGAMVGKTAVGRATVQLLKLNAPHRVAARRDLMEGGVFWQ